MWRAILVTACVLPLLLSLRSCAGLGFFTPSTRAVGTPPWVSVLLPTTGGTNTETHSPVIAAGNGERLYDCLTPLGGAGTTSPGRPPQLWVTDDSAQHWRHVADLPMPSDVTRFGLDCLLIGDDLDGARLVATLFVPGAFPATTTQPSTSYFSADGGASWRALPNVDGMRVVQMATRAGLTYAHRVAGAPDGFGRSALSVSDDNLRSWRAVDADIQRDPHQLANVPLIRDFWLRAEDGVLVVLSVYQENKNGSSSRMLWRSADGGSHWSKEPLPSGYRDLVNRPTAGRISQPICANPTQLGQATLCTSDGGVTWRPLTTAQSAKNPDRVASVYPIAQTGAGDLIAWVEDAEGPDEGPNLASLQRLRAGASAWDVVESKPSEIQTSYAPTPGGGVLWRMITTLWTAPNGTDEQYRRISYLPYSTIG